MTARTLRVGLAFVLAFATAGCAEGGGFDPDGADFGAEGGEFRLEGTFARGATQEDFDAARGVADAQGAAFTMTPSDPPRFALSGMTQAACESARADLEVLRGVDSVGACSDLPNA